MHEVGRRPLTDRGKRKIPKTIITLRDELTGMVRASREGMALARKGLTLLEPGTETWDAQLFQYKRYVQQEFMCRQFISELDRLSTSWWGGKRGAKLMQGALTLAEIVKEALSEDDRQ